MKLKSIMVGMLLGLPVTAVTAQQVYCPQHAKFIDIGMSISEVTSACGEPISKQKSNVPITKKIPVEQLIYTVSNPGSLYPALNARFYTAWDLPSGTAGITSVVNIVDGKVKSIDINGSSSNVMSVCNDNKVQIGDPISAVYSACGSPATINSTYINQPIQSQTQPEVWIYKMSDYESPMSLTFVDGKLQSIN